MRVGVISIVIPVYNAEKYLRETIDAVQRQSYKEYELLLINDGSTDKSGDICDEYAKKDDAADNAVSDDTDSQQSGEVTGEEAD